jgi:hypothetical protein
MAYAARIAQGADPAYRASHTRVLNADRNTVDLHDLCGPHRSSHLSQCAAVR